MNIPPIGSNSYWTPPLNSFESPEIFIPDERIFVSLSKNPPLPINGINSPQSPKVAASIQNFIAHHITSEEQEAVKYMMSKLDYISFKEFHEKLLETSQNLFNEIGSTPFLLISDFKSSNKWVAELALQNSMFQPEKVIEVDKLDIYLKNSPNLQAAKTIVLMDDASYSGDQMSGYINRQLISLLDSNIKDFKIYIVIPFVTKMALHAFETTKYEILEEGGDLQVFYHSIMPTAADKFFHLQHKITLYSMYYPGNVYALLFFLKEPAAKDFLKREKFLDYQAIMQHPIGKLLDIRKFHQLTNDIEKLKKEDPEQYQLLLDLSIRINSFIQAIIDTKFLEMPNDAFKNFIQGYSGKLAEEGFRSRALTIFDHKVADKVSLPVSLSQGYILHKGRYLSTTTQIPSITKPIKIMMFEGFPPYHEEYP